MDDSGFDTVKEQQYQLKLTLSVCLSISVLVSSLRIGGPNIRARHQTISNFN